MPSKKLNLVGPNVDFWLVGGGSIIFLLLAHLLAHFRTIPSIDSYFLNIGLTAGFLAIFVNNPHFTISYKLAYSQGLSFIKQHYFCLVIVPLSLVLTFTLAYSSFATFGKSAMETLVQVLFLTVGWHYTKQSYGCTMVYASFEKYYFTWFQKQSLRYQLLSVWWVAVAHSNLGHSEFHYYSLPYTSFNLSHVTYNGVLFVWFLLTLNVLYNVFWKAYKASGRLPPINVVAPWLAMILWWHPWSRQEEFYLFVVPFFHSIQYLAFVYKVEATKSLESHLSQERQLLKNILSISALLTLTWFYFELVPNHLDYALSTFDDFRIEFFIISAMLFINIHHYFLDHVLWRFENQSIKKYLLASN